MFTVPIPLINDDWTLIVAIPPGKVATVQIPVATGYLVQESSDWYSYPEGIYLDGSDVLEGPYTGPYLPNAVSNFIVFGGAVNFPAASSAPASPYPVRPGCPAFAVREVGDDPTWAIEDGYRICREKWTIPNNSADTLNVWGIQQSYTGAFGDNTGTWQLYVTLKDIVYPPEEKGFIFAKGDYTYGTRVKVIDDSTIAKATTGEAPATNSTFQGNSYQGERRLDFEGVIQAASHNELDTKWDEFMQYHQAGPPEMILMKGYRWVWGAVDGPVARKFTSLRHIEWQASMVCGDPYYYQTGLQSAIFGSEPELAIDYDGKAFATPYVTFTVSAITTPGTSFFEIENTSAWVSEQGRTQTFKFYPATTGTYTVYFGPNCTTDRATNVRYRHKVIKGSNDLSVNKFRRGGELILMPASVSSTNEFTLSSTGVTFSAKPNFFWYDRYI